MSRQRSLQTIAEAEFISIGELARLTGARYSTLKFYTEEGMPSLSTRGGKACAALSSGGEHPAAPENPADAGGGADHPPDSGGTGRGRRRIKTEIHPICRMVYHLTSGVYFQSISHCFRRGFHPTGVRITAMSALEI